MLVIDFCRSKPLPQKLAQGGRRLCLLVIYHLMLGKMMCMYTAIDDACYSSATFLSPHLFALSWIRKGFFQDVAEVVDVRLACSEDGSFRGFGHVEFATDVDAEKVRTPSEG